jgi:exopolysaccharide biosynthesis polyprenyl glycosylphosphotransferase
VRRALAGADAAGLTLAFVIASWVAPLSPASGAIGPRAEALVFLATLPGWIILAKLYGLYERDEERTDHSTVDDLVGVFHVVTMGVWSVFLASWLSGVLSPGPRRLVVFWALAVLLVVIARATARAYARRRPVYTQNTLIVGADTVGQAVARKIRRHPEYGLNVVGFVDRLRGRHLPLIHDALLLGSTDELAEVVARFDVERVIVAFGDEPRERSLDVIRGLRDLDVQIDIVPRFFEVVGPSARMHTVEGLPLMGLSSPRLSRSSLFLKRILDVGLSVVGLVCLAPLFAAVAIAIKLDSPGPVFFRQKRVGTKNRTFDIIKFRTMVPDAEDQKASLAHLNKHAIAGVDARMFKIENDPRVTAIGRWLRRTSIDELPQLVNVVRGDMSLVGPRPLILDEDRHVDLWARNRLRLQPGLTGLWQVLGRDDIPFSEMVQLDYLYVTTWSLRADVKLLLQTLPALLRNNRAA